MSKDLLILERSSSELEFKSEGGSYVLEGVFGELDVKNRNNRIYTAKEYLPQIEALQAKIKASKLLGELDHPQNFDVSLKNVSHVIEEITYDEDAKQIKGRIRLLDTDAGRQAKALVDAGVPLQISSRAAGAVESNGQVKIKQLFTYDLVADPGFENAELKRVNESYGFSNDDSIQIFEIESGEANLLETNVIENKEETKMAESKFISVEDFNKYSQYLAEEIKSLKETMESATQTEETNEIKNVKEYMTYLAEKLDQSISYSEHVAEKTDQAISYSEHVAEKVDQSISYSEHLAEGVNQIKEYTNYLAESYNEGAETHENLLKYVDYLRENLQSVTEYAEYVAETVNTNLITESEEDAIDEASIGDLDAMGPDHPSADKLRAMAKKLGVKMTFTKRTGEGAKFSPYSLAFSGDNKAAVAKVLVAAGYEDLVDEIDESVVVVNEASVGDLDAMGPDHKGTDKLRAAAKKLGVRMTFTKRTGETAKYAPYSLAFSGPKAGVAKMMAMAGYEDLLDYIEESAGIPAEDMKDELNDVTPTEVFDGEELEKAEDRAEDVSADLELEGEGDAAGEEISEGAGKELSEIEAENNAKDVSIDKEFDGEVIDEDPKNIEDELELDGKGSPEGEELAKEGTPETGDQTMPSVDDAKEIDVMESYKNEITEKLQSLINKASEKATNDPHFFRFVSESTKNDFNELATEDKTKVLSAIEGKGFLTEGQILGLWNHALITDAPKAGEPNVLSMMPSEYREAWTGLSEAKKSQILAQSKYHVLETAYQVANFWQTRDLRETAPVMEKVAMVKESKEEQASTIGYDTTDIAAQIAKRFNK